MKVKERVEVERLWCRNAGAVSGLCLLALIGLGITGCSDHRISLDRFLEMQRQAPETAETTELPADVETLRVMIDRQLGPYKVGPSDVLLVALVGADPTAVFPPVQVRVNRNGEIDLPVVGAVNVADMELEDVEETIHQACVPQVVKDVAVHVVLVSEDATDVLVVGAVSMPGLVPLRRTERDMLHAIVAAGGVSEVASGRATLRRIRNPGEEVTANLTDPEGLEVALALDPLEDGDIITVQAAIPNTIFVGGLVNAPRPQMYAQGVEMTVLQALAASGGLRTDVTPRGATLIRRMSDGSDVHVKLNLDRITTGKDPNIVLAAGDVLWVPDTIETRVQDWVNRNIFVRAGVSANVSYNVSGIEYMNRTSQQSLRGFGGGGGIEESFDPFGFLTRGSSLQTLTARPAPAPAP